MSFFYGTGVTKYSEFSELDYQGHNLRFLFGARPDEFSTVSLIASFNKTQSQAIPIGLELALDKPPQTEKDSDEETLKVCAAVSSCLE